MSLLKKKKPDCINAAQRSLKIPSKGNTIEPYGRLLTGSALDNVKVSYQ